MKTLGRLLAALACAGLSATGAQADTVSFAGEIAPTLRTQCATCHMTGDEPGGMKLYPSAAYQSLVQVPSASSPLLRVAPGAPQESYLLHKLQGTHLEVSGQGVQMPFGQPPLSDETLQLIRRWIEQGAPNN